MCLLLLAWQHDARHTLVLAGNRDEFHDRPAAPADWWDGSIIGGRDLRAGGTWLAAHRDGRFAVVTNYREPIEEGRGPRTRGELVAAYLQGELGPDTYAREIARRGAEYGGFNLLIGSPDMLVYLSNRGRGPEILEPGVYGLSNHLLDSPWPKLERSRKRFERLLLSDPTPEALLEILADRRPATDHELPDTGIGLEWERLLSSPFIVSPHYGTRCSTVLMLRQGQVAFTERRFNAAGEVNGHSSFDYTIAEQTG